MADRHEGVAIMCKQSMQFMFQLLETYEVFGVHVICSKVITDIKNSEYDQEIPQSQTADHPIAPQGRAAQPS